MYTLIVNCASVSGNKFFQIYNNVKRFVYVDSIPTKGDTGMTLGLFCEMFGFSSEDHI